MAGSSRSRSGNDGPGGDFTTGHFGLDSLLNFDWQIAVGDLRFSPDEFARLAERRVPLVRYGGRWVQIDVEAADRAARLLEKKAAGTMTLAEAFRTAFTTTAADGVPIIGLRGTSWVGQLLEQAPTAKVESLTQPTAFDGTLRPYQLRGLDWLTFLSRLGIGGCLADDMGLGKAQPLDAKILTPTGWKRMGDIQVGDYVINEGVIRELKHRQLDFAVPSTPNFTDEIPPFVFDEAHFTPAPPLPLYTDIKTFMGYRRAGTRASRVSRVPRPPTSRRRHSPLSRCPRSRSARGRPARGRRAGRERHRHPTASRSG